MVLFVSVLLANIVSNWLDEYMLTFRDSFKPYVFTWIGMLVVVLLYYPLFNHIDKWATVLSEKAIRSGNKFWGRYLGPIFTFLIILLALYTFYGYEWFGRNVLFDFGKHIYNAIVGLIKS